MRRAPLTLATLTSLAACGMFGEVETMPFPGAAPPTAPTPIAAEVVRAVLVVHLSDGQRCVALAPLMAGAGEFGNCAGYGWRVLADPSVAPFRAVVDRGLALLPTTGAPLVAVSGPAGIVALGLPG